jgi:hypothetical protein
MAKKTSKKAAKKPVARKKAAAPRKKKPAQRAAERPAAKATPGELRKKYLRTRTVTAAAAASDAAASLPRSARDVVAAAMPKMRIVTPATTSSADAQRQATAHGAGLDALREKYCDLPPAANRARAATAADRSEVVLVDTPAGDAAKRGPGPKAVIVSDGKIIGRQG